MTSPQTGYTASLYWDVSELLRNGLVKPPAPEVGLRTDGVGLIYRGHTNSFVGDPESGKTMAMLAIVAEVLILGGKALVVDMDHNGPSSTISRLKAMGVQEGTLADPQRFRFAEPEDAAAIAQIIADARTWEPDLVGLDSVGELLPIYGASSNSPDDFTRVHSAAIKPFATIGAAVLLIDHLAKNSDSRNYGASGTAAKKRAISGTSLRVVVTQAFTPGTGGKSEISIIKDRHGGLRAKSPMGDREPLAAKFELTDRNGALNGVFRAPEAGEHASTGRTPQSDLDALGALVPTPKSANDAQKRLGWQRQRALQAFKDWRLLNEVPGTSSEAGTIIDFPTGGTR